MDDEGVATVIARGMETANGVQFGSVAESAIAFRSETWPKRRYRRGRVGSDLSSRSRIGNDPWLPRPRVRSGSPELPVLRLAKRARDERSGVRERGCSSNPNDGTGSPSLDPIAATLKICREPNSSLPIIKAAGASVADAAPVPMRKPEGNTFYILIIASA